MLPSVRRNVDVLITSRALNMGFEYRPGV